MNLLNQQQQNLATTVSIPMYNNSNSMNPDRNNSQFRQAFVPSIASSSSEPRFPSNKTTTITIIQENGKESDCEFATRTPLSMRIRTTTACLNCKKAHACCDFKRPCGRCVRKGVANSCIDPIPQKRGPKGKKKQQQTQQHQQQTHRQHDNNSNNNIPTSPTDSNSSSASSTPDNNLYYIGNGDTSPVITPSTQIQFISPSQASPPPQQQQQYYQQQQQLHHQHYRQLYQHHGRGRFSNTEPLLPQAPIFAPTTTTTIATITDPAADLPPMPLLLPVLLPTTNLTANNNTNSLTQLSPLPSSNNIHFTNVFASQQQQQVTVPVIPRIPQQQQQFPVATPHQRRPSVPSLLPLTEMQQQQQQQQHEIATRESNFDVVKRQLQHLNQQWVPSSSSSSNSAVIDDDDDQSDNNNNNNDNNTDNTSGDLVLCRLNNSKVALSTKNNIHHAKVASIRTTRPPYIDEYNNHVMELWGYTHADFAKGLTWFDFLCKGPARDAAMARMDAIFSRQRTYAEVLTINNGFRTDPENGTLVNVRRDVAMDKHGGVFEIVREFQVLVDPEDPFNALWVIIHLHIV